MLTSRTEIAHEPKELEEGYEAQENAPVDMISHQSMRIGDWRLEAELDCDKKATLSIQSDQAKLFVNAFPAEYSVSKSPASVLVEQIHGRIQTAICTDKEPAINEWGES